MSRRKAPGKWAARTALIRHQADEIARLTAKVAYLEMDDRIAFRRSVQELTTALNGEREKADSAAIEAKEMRRLHDTEVSRRVADRQACICQAGRAGAV